MFGIAVKQWSYKGEKVAAHGGNLQRRKNYRKDQDERKAKMFITQYTFTYLLYCQISIF